MADFCTNCHARLGFPGKPDIDVQEIFDAKLADQPGSYLPVGICEGCRLIAVANIDGELKVQYINSDWVDYPDLTEE